MMCGVWAALCIEGVPCWHGTIFWAGHAGEGVILQYSHPKSHLANQVLQSLNPVHEASSGKYMWMSVSNLFYIPSEDRLLTAWGMLSIECFALLHHSWERSYCISVPGILRSRIESYNCRSTYYNANVSFIMLPYVAHCRIYYYLVCSSSNIPLSLHCICRIYHRIYFCSFP